MRSGGDIITILGVLCLLLAAICVAGAIAGAFMGAGNIIAGAASRQPADLAEKFWMALLATGGAMFFGLVGLIMTAVGARMRD